MGATSSPCALHTSNVRRFKVFNISKSWLACGNASFCFLFFFLSSFSDVEHSETSNVQVKCSGRKSWLTHNDEEPIKLSRIASWDLWRGRWLGLSFQWVWDSVFENRRTWIQNVQWPWGPRDRIGPWTFAVGEWCIIQNHLHRPLPLAYCRMMKCSADQPSSGVDKDLVLRPQPTTTLGQFPNCTLQWCLAVVILRFDVGFDVSSSHKLPHHRLMPGLVERRADPRVYLRHWRQLLKNSIWWIVLQQRSDEF